MGRAPGLQGIEYQTSSPLSISSGKYNHGSAGCPIGSTALAGGFATRVAPVGTRLMVSAPLANGTGWHVGVQNDGASALTGYVWVTCARAVTTPIPQSLPTEQGVPMTRMPRTSTALSPAAMLVAILALLLAAGGVGYAAGSVGTQDLKSGAVTSAKVRDGSLRAKDLVPEEAFSYAGDPGGPVLRDGGEGDCLWTDAAQTVPGLTPVGFRVDRFGTVHLSGVAQSMPDPDAGDGECGGTADEVDEDGIVFVLPRRYRPAASVLVGHADGVLIAGPGGLDVEGGTSAPPGAVGCTSICALEGITYLPVGSPVAAARHPIRRSGPGAARVLRAFGLRPLERP